MKEFIISKKEENKDIYAVIKNMFPNLKSSTLNKAFRTKDVKVNDTRVNKDFLVKEHDIVKVYITDNLLYGISKDIFYAYEDENILVAYKPKGIVSNFEGGKKLQTTPYFDEIIREKNPNCTICHRLDTNTEGLIIFAKNDVALNEILTAFKDKKITKEYLTLVYGKLPKTQDTLSNYIFKDAKSGISKIYDTYKKGYKDCITEYSVKEYLRNINCSILSIKLHTGRTHQIRSHMKYIGNPVIGDSKYGTNKINDTFKLYSQVLFACKYTFNLDKTSPLYYLNNVNIDITDDVINKIYELIKK